MIISVLLFIMEAVMTMMLRMIIIKRIEYVAAILKFHSDGRRAKGAARISPVMMVFQ